METIKLGSLFDGSGGFPLAACLCGITPVWASEIEPYPIAVTRSRFPKMKHLGNISTINGAEIEPVDVITFGSPCQDLSVAGKRAGLKHEANGDAETTRSGLFMEAIRIITEMREATNGVYPRFAIWENVPGAFSSNKGRDFRIVLEEFIKIVEPEAVMPGVPSKGWPRADCYRGNGWSLAYRTLDAQYWGVPQRRRRIYLVADFAGGCAGEILFERKGLRGYFTEGRTPRETVAGDSTDSVRATGHLCLNDQGGSCMSVSEGVAATLRAEMHGHPPCVVVLDSTAKRLIPYTLKIRSGCAGGGKGALIQTDKSATLSTLNDQYLFQPILSAGFIADSGPKTHGIGYELEKSLTIRAGGTCETVCCVWDARGNGDGVVSSTITGDHENRITDYTNVVCMQRNCIDKNAKQNGSGVKEDISFTLNTVDRHAVAYKLEPKYIVRRLTPTECARLQGFPDTWGEIERKDEIEDDEYLFWLNVRNTHAAINGKATKNYTKAQMLVWYNKLHTDSAEYKMWGNGIALPTALYVMQGIGDCLNSK